MSAKFPKNQRQKHCLGNNLMKQINDIVHIKKYFRHVVKVLFQKVLLRWEKVGKRWEMSGKTCPPGIKYCVILIC